MSDVLLKRGYSYMQIQDYKLANEDFTTALQIEEAAEKRYNSDKLYHLRGKCYLHRQKWYSTIEDNTSALNKNTNPIQTNKEKALENEMLGKKDNAENKKKIF